MCCCVQGVVSGWLPGWATTYGASSRCLLLLFYKLPKATAALKRLAANLHRSLAWQSCCVSLFWLLCFFYFFVSRWRCPTCRLCSGHGFPAGVLCLLRRRPNNRDDQTSADPPGTPGLPRTVLAAEASLFFTEGDGRRPPSNASRRLAGCNLGIGISTFVGFSAGHS